MLSIRDDMLNSCTEIGITKSAVDKEKGRGETERNLRRLVVPSNMTTNPVDSGRSFSCRAGTVYNSIHEVLT